MDNLSLKDFKNLQKLLKTAIDREAFSENELKKIEELELIKKLDNLIQRLENITQGEE